MSERRRALPSIRTDEEYEAYQKALNGLTVEFNFLKTSDKVHEKMVKMAEEKDSAALRNRIHLLEEGKYETIVKNNIAAYLLAISEYEAKKEEITPWEIIRGIVNREPKVLYHLKKRYTKSKAENEGIPQVEVINLDLQSKEEAILEVWRECDLINIEKPEVSLVPIEDVAPSEVLVTVGQMVDSYLSDASITKEQQERAFEEVTNTKERPQEQAISTEKVEKSEAGSSKEEATQKTESNNSKIQPEENPSDKEIE